MRKYILLSFSTLFIAASALAQVGVNLEAKIQAKMPQIIAKADQEITRRITALTDLSTRVQSMKRVSDAGKSQISAQLQANITSLTSLKTKIDADTDQATLRTDVKSITDAYRIFVLILPQGRILAAADRIATVAAMMQTVGTKLQARITAAQGAGKDVSALQTALTDLGAKIADANTQAQAAVNTIAALQPDQSDAAKMQSNHTALVQARGNIKTGAEDLRTARQDIAKIIKALKDFHLNASGSASASSSATVGQ